MCVVCVFVSVCGGGVYTCTDIGAEHVGTHSWHWISSWSLSISFVETGYFTELELTFSASLTSLLATGIPCLFSWVLKLQTNDHATYTASLWVLRIQTLVLMLVHQVLPELSHLRNPREEFFFDEEELQRILSILFQKLLLFGIKIQITMWSCVGLTRHL